VLLGGKIFDQQEDSKGSAVPVCGAAYGKDSTS